MYYIQLVLIPGTSPPSDVTAVQTGITSIRVTWTASSNATGYRIYYASDSDSGSETVSGRETVSHTLTGLVNRESYVISVAATSDQLSSVAVSAHATVSLSKLYISTLNKKEFYCWTNERGYLQH